MIKYFICSGPEHSINIREPFIIPLNRYEDIEYLTLERIKKLLQNDQINVDNIDSIKIFNRQENAYVEFHEYDNYQINEEDVVLLLHFSEDNDQELENYIRQIDMLENLIKNQINIQTDLIFLYASPIVTKYYGGDDYKEYEEQLDYRGEIKKIIDSIKNTKKIDAVFDCCNFDTLIKSIRKKPKILHLSCHGCIDEDSFKLCLEENGERCLVELKNICEVIEQEKSLKEIDLVFISA